MRRLKWVYFLKGDDKRAFWCSGPLPNVFATKMPLIISIFSSLYICISFKFLNLRIQVTNNCRWGLAVHVAIWSCWAGPPDTSYATWFIPPKWLRYCWDTGITSPGFLRGPTGINKCSLSHSHCSSESMRDKVEAWNVGFGVYFRWNESFATKSLWSDIEIPLNQGQKLGLLRKYPDGAERVLMQDCVHHIEPRLGLLLEQR